MEEDDYKNKITKPNRIVRYKLKNGEYVHIPSLPIERQRLTIPGLIIKPDGTEIYVEEMPEQ